MPNPVLDIAGCVLACLHGTNIRFRDAPLSAVENVIRYFCLIEFSSILAVVLPGIIIGRHCLPWIEGTCEVCICSSIIYGPLRIVSGTRDHYFLKLPNYNVTSLSRFALSLRLSFEINCIATLTFNVNSARKCHDRNFTQSCEWRFLNS